MNVITPVNAPVIDPTIGQVNSLGAFQWPTARPPPLSVQRRSAIVCMRSVPGTCLPGWNNIYGYLNKFGEVSPVSPSGASVHQLALSGTNGARPVAGVIQATDGTIYGTATRERTPTAILPMARSSPYPVFRPNEESVNAFGRGARESVAISSRCGPQKLSHAQEGAREYS